MKKQTSKSVLLAAVSVIAFLINFTPLYAQEMFIDVIGGGYKMVGPSVVILESKQSAFKDQYAYANIRTPLGENPDPVKYIEISDENGSSDFSLNVDVSNFSGPVIIDKKNFQLKNCDQAPADPTCKTTLEGQADTLNLATETNDYTPFGVEALPLANGTGAGPGKWRIYPSFRLNIPSATPPGSYSSTITFTIS